jgi:hypothetical protein
MKFNDIIVKKMSNIILNSLIVENSRLKRLNRINSSNKKSLNLPSKWQIYLLKKKPNKSTFH